jgi:ribose transport system ATP-binding protein
MSSVEYAGTSAAPVPRELAVRIDQLEKSFFGVPVLKKVSIEVPAGTIVGLVGENGAGKSTLMNVLGGVVARDAGVVELFGQPFDPKSPAQASDAGIAFIHQELNLFGNLSVAENLAISSFPRGRAGGLDVRRMRAEAAEHLRAVGLDVAPTTLVEALSAGERQLVEIAKAVASDARVIILDEPTTSLTEREATRLFRLMHQLQADGRTLIFISHALRDVLEQCDELVVLRDGAVVSQGAVGGYHLDRLVEQMVGRSIEQLFPDPPAGPLGGEVLHVRNLTRRGIVKDVSFTVRSGEIVGVYGLMGSGRTELARMIFGADGFDSGAIADPSGAFTKRRSPAASIRAGVGFVTEDRREQGLFMSLPVADNIAVTTLRRFRRRAVPTIATRQLIDACRAIAATLRVKSGDIAVDEVKNLSGGNQQKVVVARWLLNTPKLLMLDEPTRGVDVGAKHDLYVTINALAERGAGVLMISSELEELMGTCHRILVVHKGEVLGRFDRGSFDRERMLATAFGRPEREVTP